MQNARYLTDVLAALAQIDQLLTQQGQDAMHTRLLQHALTRLRDDFIEDRVFSALSLPLLAWQAMPPQLQQRLEDPAALSVLNAAHLLFYAFLDLTDDVEDQELQPRFWQDLGEPLAINTGTSLLFLSQLMLQRLSLYRVESQSIYQLTQAFALAGWRLSCGQHRDLYGWRQPDLKPEDVLQTYRLKSGTSVALYLQGAGLLVDAPADVLEQLTELGLALGVAAQLRGDWLNLQQAWSSDFANGSASYPLLLLQQEMMKQDPKLWRALKQRAASDVRAHDLLRWLLSRHRLHQPIEEQLELLLQQAKDRLYQLKLLGGEIGPLESFITRFQRPLTGPGAQ